MTITEFTNESGILQLHSAQKVYVTVLCSNTTVVHMGLATKSLNKFNKIKSPFCHITNYWQIVRTFGYKIWSETEPGICDAYWKQILCNMLYTSEYKVI